MRVSHKVDYGVRVMTRLAEADAATPARPVTRSVLAAKDDLPPNFLDDILRLLRNANLVRSQRGARGAGRPGSPRPVLAPSPSERCQDRVPQRWPER